MNSIAIVCIFSIACASLFLVYENDRLLNSYILEYQQYKQKYYYLNGALSYARAYYIKNKEKLILPAKITLSYHNSKVAAILDKKNIKVEILSSSNNIGSKFLNCTASCVVNKDDKVVEIKN